MPDLRHIQAAVAVVQRAEHDLLRQAQARYQQLRAELLEQVARAGLASLMGRLPALVTSTHREMEQLYQRTGTGIAQQSAQAARDEVRRITDLLDQLMPVLAPSAPSRLVSLGATQALDWLTGVQGLLLVEATTLQAAPPAVVTERLFAAEAKTGRASIWRNGLAWLGVALVQYVWQVANHSRLAVYQAAAQTSQVAYQKQVIAAIDRQTTDCCLRAHGQIQPFDQPFHLAGTPRYADRLMQPPFHWNCRSVTTLYHPVMERIGPTTSELRTRAQQEAATR